jgi:DNA-binding transcriptional ArsR family regulator
MSDGQIARAAALFAALAEPSRLRLLQAMMHGGALTVTELVEATGLSQANVSKHLSGLHTARLVAKTREGVFVRYEIADPVVQDLCALVCAKIDRDVQQDLKATQS